MDIVISPLTTGPITGAALSSLHKFLLYGFIREDSLRASEGINLIAATISKCVFEETDNYSDEVVLMKVLELSALCVRCDVGTMLNCDEIVSVFNKCLHVSKEDTRRSSLLRRYRDRHLVYIYLYASMFIYTHRYISVSRFIYACICALFIIKAFTCDHS